MLGGRLVYQKWSRLNVLSVEVCVVHLGDRMPKRQLVLCFYEL